MVDHGVDVGRAHMSQGLNFGLAPPLNRGGEGWIDWRAGNVFGGAGASTDTGEYAGDGTVGPSVIGRGGNNSPGKLVDDVSSPVRGFDGMLPSRATDEDYEEEEDIMGMLFENTSEHNFVPPSGLGRAKGRAVVVGCGRHRRIAGERCCRRWFKGANEALAQGTCGRSRG
ncbi:hypothetical protein EDB89DRAFT_108842 [Lactarius sanguifluus]|nr:hypothetical protein EDB89DRAFT_108842 [Lactarius sanguifluus]